MLCSTQRVYLGAKKHAPVPSVGTFICYAMM